MIGGFHAVIPTHCLTPFNAWKGTSTSLRSASSGNRSFTSETSVSGQPRTYHCLRTGICRARQW